MVPYPGVPFYLVFGGRKLKRIVLYTEGMVHAKAMVVDEALAIVGSANTDMRSLLLNYEVGVLITSQAEVTQVSD